MKNQMGKRVISLFLICIIMIPAFFFSNSVTVSAKFMDEETSPTDDEWSSAFGENDPWEILGGNNQVELIGEKRFAVSLYDGLLQTITLFCMIIAFACIIAIPWVNKSESIKANKDEIVHTLSIMAMSFSAVPIFNFAKYLLDTMFGM